MDYLKGAQLAQGKTKTIYGVQGHPDLCIVSSSDNLTANDDPALTRQMELKGWCATQTTCNVFQALRRSSFPVAFIERLNATEFAAPLCTMLPLECVGRRYAMGSYCKRQPAVSEMTRFDDPVVELYLKTTKGKCAGWRGQPDIVMPADSRASDGRLVEDPLILDPEADTWTLWHSKIPLTERIGELTRVEQSRILPPHIDMSAVVSLTRGVFAALEAMWQVLGCRLIDLKVEFGFDAQGNLMLADVIGPDEWRMKKPDGSEVSKQLFREGSSLEDVSRAYNWVAEQSGLL